MKTIGLSMAGFILILGLGLGEWCLLARMNCGSYWPPCCNCRDPLFEHWWSDKIKDTP